MSDAEPKCQTRGCDNDAACFGVYEGEMEKTYACNGCCGHGNEDAARGGTLSAEAIANICNLSQGLAIGNVVSDLLTHAVAQGRTIAALTERAEAAERSAAAAANRAEVAGSARDEARAELAKAEAALATLRAIRERAKDMRAGTELLGNDDVRNGIIAALGVVLGDSGPSGGGEEMCQCDHPHDGRPCEP